MPPTVKAKVIVFPSSAFLSLNVELLFATVISSPVIVLEKATLDTSIFALVLPSYVLLVPVIPLIVVAFLVISAVVVD